MEKIKTSFRPLKIDHAMKYSRLNYVRKNKIAEEFNRFFGCGGKDLIVIDVCFIAFINENNNSISSEEFPDEFAKITETCKINMQPDYDFTDFHDSISSEEIEFYTFGEDNDKLVLWNNEYYNTCFRIMTRNTFNKYFYTVPDWNNEEV